MEDDQTALAAKAMSVKMAGAALEQAPAQDAGGRGFKNIPRADYPPSGAFDAEGHRPVLERSRKER
jgi:hypothetical protein